MKNSLYTTRRTYLIWAINFLLIFFVSCGKKERVINSTQCHPNQAALKTLTNEKGKFGYDEGKKLNTITVATTSATSVYLLCNPPVSLPALDATVTFSGTVRTSSFSGTGNTTFYEITVSSLQ